MTILMNKRLLLYQFLGDNHKTPQVILTLCTEKHKKHFIQDLKKEKKKKKSSLSSLEHNNLSLNLLSFGDLRALSVVIDTKI